MPSIHQINTFPHGQFSELTSNVVVLIGFTESKLESHVSFQVVSTHSYYYYYQTLTGRISL